MTTDVALRENVHTVALRPNDFDWSLQLNNSVYLELFEIGRWQWCLANGIDLKHHNLIGVVVRLEIDYIKPVLWNPVAELNIRTKLLKLELYSIYFQQQLEDLQGKIMTKALLRLALYDRQQNIPVRIDLKKIKRSLTA